jgi:hypothetical protein
MPDDISKKNQILIEKLLILHSNMPKYEKGIPNGDIDKFNKLMENFKADIISDWKENKLEPKEKDLKFLGQIIESIKTTASTSYHFNDDIKTKIDGLIEYIKESSELSRYTASVNFDPNNLTTGRLSALVMGSNPFLRAEAEGNINIRDGKFQNMFLSTIAQMGFGHRFDNTIIGFAGGIKIDSDYRQFGMLASTILSGENTLLYLDYFKSINFNKENYKNNSYITFGIEKDLLEIGKNAKLGLNGKVNLDLDSLKPTPIFGIHLTTRNNNFFGKF